jgi:hypothetical protein
MREQTVPELRELVIGFPPPFSGFDPRSGNMGFVVENVARKKVFL